MDNSKILNYCVMYFLAFITSAIFLFLPWRIQNGVIFLGVETIHLLSLFIINIGFMIPSIILYFIYYTYENTKIAYIVGFGVGIAGEVLGVIIGVFGIYYSFIGIRAFGIMLLGSAIYWIIIAIIIVINALILVNFHKEKTKTVPITDL